MIEWPGVESRESREALLADLSTAAQAWANVVVDCVAGRPPEYEPELAVDVAALASALPEPQQREALARVVLWGMSGLVHSALVVMGGGASRTPTLELRDSKGQSLGDALHEEWPDFDVDPYDASATAK